VFVQNASSKNLLFCIIESKILKIELILKRVLVCNIQNQIESTSSFEKQGSKQYWDNSIEIIRWLHFPSCSVVNQDLHCSITMSSSTPNYGQREDESTADWLRRLIGMNAPPHIVSGVQQILASEQASGNYIIVTPLWFLHLLQLSRTDSAFPLLQLLSLLCWRLLVAAAQGKMLVSLFAPMSLLFMLFCCVPLRVPLPLLLCPTLTPRCAPFFARANLLLIAPSSSILSRALSR
jgi:hypothetical protein